VTNTGPTTIGGDLGLYPGTSFTNTGGITITGTYQLTNGVAQQAQLDETNAYNVLKSQPFTSDLTGQTLGTAGVISALNPGVYRFSTTAQLNGALTLNATAGALFIFQIGTSLTTGSGSSVQVVGGDANVGVYWVLGVTGGSGTGSATLGTSTSFAGNILALDSVTLNTTAKILCGRAFAQVGAVTMDSNTISGNCANGGDYGSGRTDFGSAGFSGGGAIQLIPEVPEPGSIVLLGIGFIGLAAWFRRRGMRKARTT
jgi:type VI secretion system secreted protein VgrG